jgi:methyl-accepting chemotaxis protein
VEVGEMDLTGDAQADPNPLQKLMEAIPGFSGYYEREQRRDADKRLREFLAEDIGEIIERIERIATEWSKAGELDYLDDLEEISGRLGRAADNLRYADYGYSGFFDLVKIDADDLNRFYQYDLSLRSFIADIGDDVEALTEAADDEIEDALADLDEDIDELNEMIEDRESVATDLVP